MIISVVERRQLPTEAEPDTFILRKDGWNDYGYYTLFDLYHYDKTGKRSQLGSVKVMTSGLETGDHPLFPDEPFSSLDERYCSLGQDQAYYEAIFDLESGLRESLLRGLRDCVLDPNILAKFEHEKAFHTSLMRSVRRSDVDRLFPSILNGSVVQTPFNFSFEPASSPKSAIEVEVEPQSLPPSNIHVLIGRNGVGKTRLLSGIVDQLLGRTKGDIGVEGAVTFAGAGEDERFTSVVSVAFSAFDRFEPIEGELFGSVRYAYVGLKRVTTEEEAASGSELKSGAELSAEFETALEACLNQPRKDRWVKAIRSLSSDPIFAEHEIDTQSDNEDALRTITEVFHTLSSGHKIVLLTVTRLVELVDEKTLVLMDEPETHLHPPLLASFTNVLSDLLINRNGVALIATHSPVVLQEVPRKCVTIVDRSGSSFRFYRPSLETYGENVGTLTREVFNLEVLDSGFHRRIKSELEIIGYDQLLEKFGQQIGGEGRALARVLDTKRRQ